MATVADIASLLESRFRPELAEPWDVNGLTVGDPHATVGRVLFAVDPTLAVVDEAIVLAADLIVTHHPLMLRGVTSVAASTPKGAVVHRLITSGISLYNAHTNADAAAGGVCDALAAAIGVVSPVPLIPASDSDAEGTGRIGMLAGPVTLEEFARGVAAALPSTEHGVRVAGPLDGIVTTVAVLGGAGDSYLEAARLSGADAYVTADLRHHPASEARELAALGDGRPYLVDVSHYASEWAWLVDAAEHVADAAAVDTVVSTLSTDPWTARFSA
jgi:dinuclear metal center YbgI/SA1388 family protein